MFKRYFFIIILFLMSLSVDFGAAAASYAPDEPVSAKSYYVYNIDTETVITSKDADKPMYPASLTKIMTCLLALEKTSDLDSEMVTYPQYVQDFLYTYQRAHGAVSLGGLISGEELSMREVLYALMLPSANEAAMIIADHISGSQEAFVELMNTRARELGATRTNFANANGLFDENHMTTAEDIAKITLYAMEQPGFMEIVTATARDSGPTNKHDNLHWESTNLMMMPEKDVYYPGLSGIKTGTLPQAGRCFVSTATRDGFRYLVVIMGSDYLDENGKVISPNQAFADARTLFNWAFSSFRVKTLVDKGKYVAEIPLHLSMDKDFIKLMTAERFTSLIYYSVEASSVTIMPEIPDSIDAPVKRGDEIGEARLILSGEEIGRVKLLAAESVEASQLLIVWDKVKRVMYSFWFKFALIFFVLLIIAYTIAMIIRNRRLRRMGRGGGKSGKGGKGGYRPKRRL